MIKPIDIEHISNIKRPIIHKREEIVKEDAEFSDMMYLQALSENRIVVCAAFKSLKLIVYKFNKTEISIEKCIRINHNCKDMTTYKDQIYLILEKNSKCSVHIYSAYLDALAQFNSIPVNRLCVKSEIIYLLNDNKIFKYDLNIKKPSSPITDFNEVKKTSKNKIKNFCSIRTSGKKIFVDDTERILVSSDDCTVKNFIPLNSEINIFEVDNLGRLFLFDWFGKTLKVYADGMTKSICEFSLPENPQINTFCLTSNGDFIYFDCFKKCICVL